MASATIIAPRHHTRAASRYAWVVLALFVLVVLWGAVVRATGSGGGCGPNWPLCNGYINPLHHARLATLIEFIHRSTSGIVTFMLVALAVWTFAITPNGHRARRAVLWSVFFLITEALLGAALVLRHWVENNASTSRTIAQSIHFTNTMLLMGAIALTAWFLRDGENDVVGARVSPSIAWTAILATILVGATGSLAALADTLFPSQTLVSGLAQDFAANAPILIRMRWLHPAAALVGLVCAILLVRSQPRRDRTSRAVVFFLATQFVLGPLDVLLLAPTWMQVLHLLGADLYWIALVVLSARIIWPTTLLKSGNFLQA